MNSCFRCQFAVQKAEHRVERLRELLSWLTLEDHLHFQIHLHRLAVGQASGSYFAAAAAEVAEDRVWCPKTVRKMVVRQSKPCKLWKSWRPTAERGIRLNPLLAYHLRRVAPARHALPR